MKERKKRFNLRLPIIHREFDRLEQVGWRRVAGRIRWGSRIRWGRGNAGPSILTRRVVARWMKDDYLFAKTPPPI